MAKYLLLRGSHSENGNLYNRGTEFESTNENLENHNSPGSVKFQRLDAQSAPPVAASPVVEKDIQKMTTAQLKAFAKTEGIDIEGAISKKEILEVIELETSG